jgi:uncharacterized membrane protein HdeD (DUF308 family)
MAKKDKKREEILPPGTGTVTADAGKWWVVALLGVLSIVAGVLALAYPDITLLVLGLIVGIYFIVFGSIWVMLGVSEPLMSTGGRILRILVGFLALLAGLICLVRPGAGVLTLLIALSFWFILVGVSDLARATEGHEHRVIAALLGVVSIAAGVIIVADPDIGLATLALIAGIGLIVRGSIEVMASVYIRQLAQQRRPAQLNDAGARHTARAPAIERLEPRGALVLSELGDPDDDPHA